MSLDQLKRLIKAVLPDLDMVIGWKQGHDGLTATPLFIRSEDDVEKLQIGPLAVHNLATFLPGLKDKKVGVVVKGCDSRAAVQLLQEKLIDRANVTIFGFGCDGVVSHAKLRKQFDAMGRADSMVRDGDTVTIEHDDESTALPFNEICPDKCLTCEFPNAVIHDHFAGERIERTPIASENPALAEFEKLPISERLDFWQNQMGRCIRCHACRNACPMCVCRDHCLATSRDPNWIGQETSPRENLMFQMTHTMHLAGRCVECGECERACPMDIPVFLLRKKMADEVKELFDYNAGVNPDAKPPLMTFETDERNIKE